MAVVYELWRHRDSGEVFASRTREEIQELSDHVDVVVGPLTAAEVNHWHKDPEREDYNDPDASLNVEWFQRQPVTQIEAIIKIEEGT